MAKGKQEKQRQRYNKWFVSHIAVKKTKTKTAKKSTTFIKK